MSAVLKQPREQARRLGRPRRYDRQALLEAFETYIKATEIPIEAEFAYMHDIDARRVYDWPEFAHALAIFRCKKEAALAIGGLYGTLNPRMTILALKQFWWSDQGDRTLKGARDAPVRFIVSEKMASKV
jgi:hypothetical protein